MKRSETPFKVAFKNHRIAIAHRLARFLPRSETGFRQGQGSKRNAVQTGRLMRFLSSSRVSLGLFHRQSTLIYLAGFTRAEAKGVRARRQQQQGTKRRRNEQQNNNNNNNNKQTKRTEKTANMSRRWPVKALNGAGLNRRRDPFGRRRRRRRRRPNSADNCRARVTLATSSLAFFIGGSSRIATKSAVRFRAFYWTPSAAAFPSNMPCRFRTGRFFYGRLVSSAVFFSNLNADRRPMPSASMERAVQLELDPTDSGSQRTESCPLPVGVLRVEFRSNFRNGLRARAVTVWRIGSDLRPHRSPTDEAPFGRSVDNEKVGSGASVKYRHRHEKMEAMASLDASLHGRLLVRSRTR